MGDDGHDQLHFCDTFSVPATWYNGDYTAYFSPFRMTMTQVGATYYSGEGGTADVTLRHVDQGEFLVRGLPAPMPDKMILAITREDKPEWRFKEDKRLFVSPFGDQTALYNSENFMRDLRMDAARPGTGKSFANCSTLSDLGRIAGTKEGISGDLDVF